jgi:hypothetical protein
MPLSIFSENDLPSLLPISYRSTDIAAEPEHVYISAAIPDQFARDRIQRNRNGRGRKLHWSSGLAGPT